MGATVTTFCNATNIVLSTYLTVIIPYYSTHHLEPGKCVSYKVGRVWFTASAEMSVDTTFGNLYFPVSGDRAAGLLHGSAYVKSDLNYVNMTPEEATTVMKSSNDVIQDDIHSVSVAYRAGQLNLMVDLMGYYANKNQRITITGGPKAIVTKQHPLWPDKHIEIVPANFEPLQMTVTDD